jgi:hypothetical protein
LVLVLQDWAEIEVIFDNEEMNQIIVEKKGMGDAPDL